MIEYAVHTLLWAERFDIDPESLVEKAKKTTGVRLEQEASTGTGSSEHLQRYAITNG
jgi:hypothetical protein